MNVRTSLAAALLALAFSLPCAAQDKGYWTAASSSANAITGDLAILKDRITINLISFDYVRVRALTPTEVGALFDADVNAGVTGTLYHVDVPAAQRFVHKNTLCGTESTQWMVTFASARTLQVAFFSGSNTPVFTFEVVRNSQDLCGTFAYAR